MADLLKTKVKTKLGEFYWVKGLNEDGEYNELSKKYERVVNIRFKKDSPEADYLIGIVDELWADFKKANLKVRDKQPKSVPYKEVLDQEGEPTGEIEFKFKTNATFPDGSLNIVNVYDAKGHKVTAMFLSGDKKVGNGSTGITFGTFAVYEYLKKFGITSYLTALQIKELKEFEEDIDLDDLGDGFEADMVDSINDEADRII